MKRKYKKTVNNSRMIADIKHQLTKASDPIDKEALQQRLHHYQMQSKNTKSD